MSRFRKAGVVKEQWQAFRAEWGYHIFFWLFLSVLAALVAVSRSRNDENALLNAPSHHFKFPAEAADKPTYGERTSREYLSV